MTQPTLIDVPRTYRLSRHDRLQAFKAEHGIESHCCRDVPDPWLVCHMGKAREIGAGYGITETSSFFDCIATVGRLLDEAGVTEYGKTEREAIQRLCENLKIPCSL